MSSHRSLRLPISTRHAFALAFDLAARRDALHSLIVPLVIRAPWILALALLPPLSQTDRPVLVMLLTVAALIGDFVILLTVGAMLRFRARSVFNTPAEMHPAPVTECYARGLKRVPWLLVTEVARNLALVLATLFFILPALLFGFRLAFATEAVVLSEPNTSRAFQRSFRLTEGRFERWLEMIVASVLLVFAAVFVVATLSLTVPGVEFAVWLAVARLLITAVTPIIQYAWTFFYMRLTEIETQAIEVGPAYAAAGAAQGPSSAPGPMPFPEPTPEVAAGSPGAPALLAIAADDSAAPVPTSDPLETPSWF